MRGLFFGGALVGVLVGFGLGLVLAWYYWPAPMVGANPADLRLDLKDDYLRMIASSYSLDGDLARALQRLEPLNLAQPDLSISELVQREPNSIYREALIHMALDLRQPSVAMARPTSTPRPTKTRLQAQTKPAGGVKPTASRTPDIISHRPTLSVAPQTPPTFAATRPALPPSTVQTEPTLPPPTSTPDPAAPFFSVKSSERLDCLATQGRGLFEVEVQSSDGRPMPGIGVELSWNGGYEIFYTGLKPERGMGYADVQVSPGIYNLRLTEDARSEVVLDLTIDDEPTECLASGSELRGWKLVFQQSQ